MLVIGILSFVLLLLIVMLMFMRRVYKTKPRPHLKDPASIGLEFTEVRYQTKNNKSLYGWWIPTSSDPMKPIIILVHGWTRNVQRMLPYVKFLHTGFNLLAFDSRCHGSSDTDNYSSMPRFAEDILSTIGFIKNSYPGRTIGVLGLSMGGAAAIFAASKSEEIRAVATVGAFAHPADVMRLEFKKRHIPHFPMVWILFEYMQFVMKDRFNEIAPERNIAHSSADFLIIHGTDDMTAPVIQAERLIAASRKENTELCLLNGMGHSNCHEYPGIETTLNRFFADKLAQKKAIIPDSFFNA